MLEFTYTRQNLYLDLLILVIGFQHFITLWKAFNKSNQIKQFLQRIACRKYFLQIWIGWVKVGCVAIWSTIILHNFCLLTRFPINIWIFINLPFFSSDYWSRARGLSENISNVIDLCHNKKIEGEGVNLTPSPQGTRHETRR